MKQTLFVYKGNFSTQILFFDEEKKNDSSVTLIGTTELEIEPVKKEVKYPCFKKYIIPGEAYGTVILFTEGGCGTVVVKSSVWPLGWRSGTWAELLKPEEWVEIKGIKEIE